MDQLELRSRDPIDATIFVVLLSYPAPNLPDFALPRPIQTEASQSEWSPAKSSNCKKRFGGAGQNRTDA
jgi:hypothetical protein